MQACILLLLNFGFVDWIGFILQEDLAAIVQRLME